MYELAIGELDVQPTWNKAGAEPGVWAGRAELLQKERYKVATKRTTDTELMC